MLSVNSFYGAAVALQNLNATDRQLSETQNRINTGLKIAGPKDNGAVFSISQGMRADVQALGAVGRSIDRAVSVIDTAIAAGSNVAELLVQMKEQALAARDPTIDATTRFAYFTEFAALRDMITTTLESAAFDGSNIVNSSTGLLVPVNVDGTSFMTVAARNMSMDAELIVVVDASQPINSAFDAAFALGKIETSLNNINLALSQLGTDARKLSMHKAFTSKLTDVLNKGIGNLVDAELPRESAKLQSLQTKQQLGVQALSIANQAPQSILSLFRN